MSSSAGNSIPGPEFPPIRHGMDTSMEDFIENWSWHIFHCYGSPEEMQRTKVVRLDWYKYAKGVEHEYVLATVLRDGQRFYLRLERRASDEAAVNEKNVLREENIESFSPEDQARFAQDVSMEKKTIRNHNMWANIRRSSNKISTKDNIPRADDTVTQVISPNGVTQGDNGKVNHLASYEFSSKPLYLRDLAMILQHINKSSVGYSLLLEQCYWFSRTCIGVAMKRCAPKETQNPRWNTGGTYWVAKSDTARPKSEVTRLTVNRDNPDQISEFALAVDASIQEHDQQLADKYMKGEGGRIQAEQEAAEERRQKLQETQRADRECRRADEIEAKYQELQAYLKSVSSGSVIAAKAQ